MFEAHLWQKLSHIENYRNLALCHSYNDFLLITKQYL